MESTISQMTVGEFRKLIADVVSEVVDEKLSELIDPDRGLELREDFAEILKQQDERLKNGERGIPMEEVFDNFDR